MIPVSQIPYPREPALLLRTKSCAGKRALSFNRRDAEPERAQRDLVLALETLAARPGLDAALDAATVRLTEDGDEAAWVEQQRLRQARDEADRQLATLLESGAGLPDRVEH